MFLLHVICCIFESFALSSLLRLSSWIPIVYLTSLIYSSTPLEALTFLFSILFPYRNQLASFNRTLFSWSPKFGWLLWVSHIFRAPNLLIDIVSFPSPMSLTFLPYSLFPLPIPVSNICLPQKLFTKCHGYLEGKIHMEPEPKSCRWFSSQHL